jgi:hypothetical protein
LPTAVAASGTLVYAADTGASQALDDIVGDGTWQSFDMDLLELLPMGYGYKVTGVKACFESSES